MKVNPKAAKMIAKAVLGLGFSAIIGYTIKMEKRIEDRIDAHYGEPQTETDQQNN